MGNMFPLLLRYTYVYFHRRINMPSCFSGLAQLIDVPSYFKSIIEYKYSRLYLYATVTLVETSLCSFSHI